MKIALASNDKKLSEHFGLAKEFIIFDTETKEKEILENPGHQPAFLPKFLKEKNIDCLITGGIGQKAIDLFNEYEIKIIITDIDSIENIIEKYMKNELKEINNSCDH